MACSEARGCLCCCLQVMEDHVQGNCHWSRNLWEAYFSSFLEAGDFAPLVMLWYFALFSRKFLSNLKSFDSTNNIAQLLVFYTIMHLFTSFMKANPDLCFFFFPSQPGNRDGTIQCFIKRDKSNLTYHLFLCLSPGMYCLDPQNAPFTILYFQYQVFKWYFIVGLSFLDHLIVPMDVSMAV